MTQSQNERNTVRELAREVAELAHSPENAYRRQLWRDVNSLRRPERPPAREEPGPGEGRPPPGMASSGTGRCRSRSPNGRWT